MYLLFKELTSCVEWQAFLLNLKVTRRIPEIKRSTHTPRKLFWRKAVHVVTCWYDVWVGAKD